MRRRGGLPRSAPALSSAALTGPREGDGMECEIEFSPALADGLKYGFELGSFAHVARQEDRRLKLAR